MEASGRVCSLITFICNREKVAQAGSGTPRKRHCYNFSLSSPSSTVVPSPHPHPPPPSGVFIPPGDIWEHQETSMVVTTGGGGCQGMLVNTLQCPGNPHNKELCVPNVHRAGFSRGAVGQEPGAGAGPAVILYPSPRRLGGQRRKGAANHTPAYRNQALCSGQIPRAPDAVPGRRCSYLGLQMKSALSQSRGLSIG